MKQTLTLALLLMGLVATGCDKSDTETATTDSEETTEATGLKTDHGVDADKKVIRLGALNDESGPAAAIGKPYAVGKRILVEQVNSGSTEFLPEGWTLELVEKDHGYNPQQSVQSYNEIKDDVLYITTSFGTPNTLPLLKMLERDSMVAQPASLSSKMAENAHTPPAGPAYYFEAMRAMDFAVDQAEGAENVKAGIVYQQDDYGKDGIYGWEQAAEAAGVEIVSSQTVAPGQKDFTAVVSALKDAGATHVMLTVLPSATGPILGTAGQLGFTPMWLASTAAWTDRFFNADVIPPQVFGNFYLLSGLPFWGEEVDGMDTFMKAYESYGKDKNDPDSYILLSYIQGLQGLEAAKRAIENEDLTRAGFLEALKSLDEFDAGGLIQPMNLSKVPYVVSTKTRVLKPKMDEKTWEVAADYAAPSGYTDSPEK